MIDNVLMALNIPKECHIAKKLFKKHFLDNFSLNATQKQILSNNIDYITLEYLLNKNTININPFIDEEKDCSEIAFVVVKITNPQKLNAINSIIQLIPYQLIVFYEFENTICINTTQKRINKNDSTKLVCTDSHFSNWIQLDNQTPIEADFLNSLNIKNQPFTDLFAFYNAITDKIIALNASKYSNKLEINTNTKDILNKIQLLENKITELSNKLKKEKSLKDRVELNMQIKQLENELQNWKKQL